MNDEKRVPVVLRKTIPSNLEKIKYGQFSEDDKDYPLHLYLREQDITVQENGSEIVKFLTGKNILITGATGFLGKLLIEKLLRSCKDIEAIYILLRSKKGKDPEARIQEYLNDFIFYKLADIRPNFKEKVHAISGDMEKDGIGISQDSRKLLINKINLIYHVAATVRFDEKLAKAVKTNVVGTYQLLQLAKECKKMMAFVYMSTAFSNCHYNPIEETGYAPHLNPYKLMNLMKDLPEDVIERISSGLLGQVPNTYTFTKQITEDLVIKEAVGFPCCIQRPSIVVGTAKEPIRSWTDNIFGPVGLMLCAGLGIAHVMYGNPDTKCDLVPADYVINHCIACSYKTAKDGYKDRTQIFNFTTMAENPIRWKNLGASEKHGPTFGSTQCLMTGFGRFTRYYYWYLFLNFWLHTIPGYIMDFMLILKGKKPLLKRAYAKINKFIMVLAYFTMNEWSFGYQNTTNLWNELSDVDKKNFNFDMKSLDWKDYLVTYLAAIREFQLQEPLDNLEESRRHMKKLDIIFYIFLTIGISSTTYFFINTIFFFIPLMFISMVVYYVFTRNNYKM